MGPVVVAVYGNTGATAHDDKNGPVSLTTLQGVIVAQAPAPRVTSTKASVSAIEDYLLQQPGVPADLAAQIRSIGDPATTLPIPVPANLAVSQNVEIDGAHGVLIGDDTGVGSGVIWQRGQMVYGVAGQLTEHEVLAIARSLR